MRVKVRMRGRVKGRVKVQVGVRKSRYKSKSESVCVRLHIGEKKRNGLNEAEKEREKRRIISK